MPVAVSASGALGGRPLLGDILELELPGIEGQAVPLVNKEIQVSAPFLIVIKEILSNRIAVIFSCMLPYRSTVLTLILTE